VPKFPRKENEIWGLARHMIAGYTEKPGMFPHADVAGLQAALAEYEAKKEEQDDAAARHHMATEAKDGVLQGLELKMQAQLKQSEVDVGADVDELIVIGWGPRAKRRPVAPPGQVRRLQIVEEGAGTLKLAWDAPDRAKGGPVRTYRIERREAPPGGGSFNEWHEVGMALKKKVSLTDQPRSVQMEYQVIAVNFAGVGRVSNAVEVVL